MSTILAKKYYILWVGLGLSFAVASQNLAPNPGFESFTSCPFNFNGGLPLQVIPWNNPTPGTSDYFNQCCNPCPVGVPQNAFGYQPARTGGGYCGFFTRTTNGNYREYLQAPLTSPLVAGTTYHVSFFVSLAETFCGTSNIGAHFSALPPPVNGINEMDVDPQIISVLGFISSTQDWTLITGCFVAEGGEAYITIGNFYPVDQTPIDPNCPVSLNISYYYIDDVEVIAGEAPQIIPLELGDPVIACSSYEINPGLEDIGYFWEDGSRLPTFTVDESGWYSLTITDGCNFGIDSIQVSIIGTSETVDLGPEEVTLCPGGTYEISLDPQWEYEWSDGITSPYYIITGPGHYQVTMNDGCDLSVDDIDAVLLSPPPPFSLGEDTHLCPGEQIEYAFNPGMGLFLWQDNSTSSSYTISQPGTYSLSISNMCGSKSDEIMVVALSEPAVDLGPAQMLLCEGESISFNLDPGQGVYQWQDGLISPTYTITQAGQYEVTVQNECGISSDAVVVGLLPAPVFDWANDTIVCPANLPLLLDMEMIPNASEYLWQDGSMDPFLYVSAPGIYSVTLSNACASWSDTINVWVGEDTPDIILPPDLKLCPGDLFTLTNIGTQGLYTWQDSSTNDSFQVSLPGLYTLTVSNACGTDVDSVLVEYLPPIALPDLGPDFSLCPGEQATLSANAPGLSLVWQDLSTQDSLLISLPGIYFVQVSNACSSASDTVVVTFSNNPPQVNLPDQINLCTGDMIIVDAGLPGVNYLWSDGSAQATLSISSPGMYGLTVSNACGTDTDSVVVMDTGPHPLVSLGNDIEFCDGNEIRLTPVFSDVSAWVWGNGSTAPSYLVTGNEMVTIQVSNQCGIAVDTVMATLLPGMPPLELGQDTFLCPGDAMTLTIVTPDVDIVWSDGSVNNQLIVHDAGIYAATISNRCGATMDTIEIVLLSGAPELNLGPDQPLCPGEIITIAPGIQNAIYTWQDGSTGDTYQSIHEETIILTVSNACGFSSDTLLVFESTNGPELDLGNDIHACEGDVITLRSGIYGVEYLWQDGSTTPDLVTSLPGTYILSVSNLCGSDADTLNVSLLTAPDDFNLPADTTLCPGEFVVLVAPSSSCEILWQDGSQQLTMIANQAITYSLRLSNACGSASDSFSISIDQHIPDIQIDPYVFWCVGDTFTLDASQPFDAHYQWSNGSISPTIEVASPGIIMVEVSTPCIVVPLEIEVSLDPACSLQGGIYIPNIFSPNGDHVNDVFTISWGPDIEIESLDGSIYDKWGDLVFKSQAVPFIWDGQFEEERLVPDVFAYALKIHYRINGEEHSEVFSGDVTLIR